MKADWRHQTVPSMNEFITASGQTGATRFAGNNGKRAHNRIALVGNYVPRRCGIATFTTDLCAALAGHSTECLAVAMNDRSERYEYGHLVSMCHDSVRADWERACRI